MGGAPLMTPYANPGTGVGGRSSAASMGGFGERVSVPLPSGRGAVLRTTYRELFPRLDQRGSRGNAENQDQRLGDAPLVAPGSRSHRVQVRLQGRGLLESSDDKEALR